MPHAQLAAARLARQRKRGHQSRLERCFELLFVLRVVRLGVAQPLGHLRFQLLSFSQHLRVTQALHLGFERIDGRDQGHDALDVALVLGADEPGHNPVEDFFYAHAFLCRLPLAETALTPFRSFRLDGSP